MADQSTESTEHRKVIGIYDRPASADRPKTRTLALAVIAIIVVVAVIYFMRAH